MLRNFLLLSVLVAGAHADVPSRIKEALSGPLLHVSRAVVPLLQCRLVCVVCAGAITSSSDVPFELHVVPPTQSNAELSRTIDSFAQATDADLAAGQQALQAQLREVLEYSGKVVPMLVHGSAFASDLVRAHV